MRRKYLRYLVLQKAHFFPIPAIFVEATNKIKVTVDKSDLSMGKKDPLRNKVIPKDPR